MSPRKSSPTSAASDTPDTLVHLDPAVILMEDNARYSTEVSRAEAEQMKASILEVGRIMEPVGVTVLETPVNGFTHRLRYGFRRVAGANLVNETMGAGSVLVPAIILHDADPTLILKEQVSENVVRKSLSLMDTATAAKKMLDAGMSRQEVRDVFKRPIGAKGGVAPASNAWLNMVLALLDLPKAIRDRVHNGDIGIAAAYKLMKAPADKRIAILEAAEKEMERVRESEDKEEKRFANLEEKVTKADADREKAEQELANAGAEVELAEKARQEAEERAADLYRKEQEAQRSASSAKSEEAKKKAKDSLKKAAEARKAAEKEAKDAESKLQAAQKSALKAKESTDKFAKAVEDGRKRLEDARAAQAAKAPKAAKKDGKVSPKAVAKAAKAAGVDQGVKKLTGPEMRKLIDDLSLVESYPKVAAVGKVIKACFDGIDTDGQMIKKLATLLGDSKTSRK